MDTSIFSCPLPGNCSAAPNRRAGLGPEQQHKSLSSLSRRPSSRPGPGQDCGGDESCGAGYPAEHRVSSTAPCPPRQHRQSACLRRRGLVAGDNRQVAELRDYVEWHKSYDDPGSDLSWRLGRVQSYLLEALEHHAGEIQVLSLCSGDGRDLLEVLAGRSDAERVRATLVELHPEIAERARSRVAVAGLGGVEVRTADAGLTDNLVGAVPADIVLMVGILGNISDADLERTIRASPKLCATGATLIWSRGRGRGDRNDLVRAWFGESGFVELHYDHREGGGLPALGMVRLEGPTEPLAAAQRLFTFNR